MLTTRWRSVAHRLPHLAWLPLSAFALLLNLPALVAADSRTGEQIYRQKCASCHGPAGEGTKKYRHPLAGDRSVPQLTKLIAETMPENKPGTLSTEEAQKAAVFIHDAFYSPAARQRNQPPRLELARLTVRQYRNAIADLIGNFRSSGRWDDRRGLNAEYFKNREFQNQARAITRVDPEVRFDFGTASPSPEKIEPHEFSIRWTGSVLAPESGEFEFTIRTEHAARLWLNDLRRPLIDAWVKSGSDTEYRGSMFLIGGRVYPLRLEYSKAKQGVDDSKNKPKPPPTKSSIRLEWKPPHRVTEVIPTRNLSPVSFPETFAVSTPFPPDDRSYGWERGTTVSKEWDQATTDAAIETAGYVAARLNELAGTREGAADRTTRLRDFAKRFAERAFRRPLADEQKRSVERQFEAVTDPDLAVKRVVLLVLKSPRFLYREASGGPDAYDVAARLSFGLWDSMPDKDLLEAAAAGKLSSREQVVAQAERMLGDLRARTKVREFLFHWLKIDQVADIGKDPKRFPGFDAAIVSDLRTSLELFLDDVVWSETADFRQLLLADETYLNGRLAKFYGADLRADAGFQKVKLNAQERAGVLTHPYQMTRFAYTAESSPIHRGVFVARGVLGVSLRPPPEAFTPLAADLHPSLTTRERVTLQTKPDSCMSCHAVINPLGFTLEHFDAVGRYREKDNGRPINAAGSYQTRSGEKVTFAGVRDLAKFLASSEEVHAAFVEQMFHHLVQQSIRAYGPRTSQDLRASFAAAHYNIRKLVVEVMATSALLERKQPQKIHYLPPASALISSYTQGMPRHLRKLIP